MFPVSDVIPSRTTPYVTIGLIVVNALAFLLEVTMSDRELQRFLMVYGAVPAYLSVTSIVTSMFLHSGWLHFGGNMLYLWIFGDNVEDRVGHGRFFVFYILCGMAAALTQTIINPDSVVPMVGASGAIAGVMGGYLLLYPHARIRTIGRFGLIYVPAWMMLGFWVLTQVLAGAAQWGGKEMGGVAYAAHVGGFVAGMLLVHLFAQGEAMPRRATAP